MDATTEETPEDRNHRKKSIGTPGSPFRGSAATGGGGGGGLKHAGGKTRRFSIGITSSQKSIGEEGNAIPNYLRASTGSCHDFCKYGKKHEHSTSAIPIKFKRATVVNKDTVTRTVVPVERKKMTTVTKLKPSTDPKIQTPAEPLEVIKRDVSLPSKKVEVSKRILSTNRKVKENELKMPQRSTSHVKPSPMMVNPSSSAPDASAELTSGIKKKDTRTVKKTVMTPKAAAVKKVVAKATLTESQSPKPSVSRVASLKARKYRNLKLVSPLKDQNRMQKTDQLEQPINDRIQIKTLHVVDAESEAKPEIVELESVPPTIGIIQSPPPPLTELINGPVSNSSQSSSDRDVLQESTIAYPVFESSQSLSDKEILEEESSIAPPVFESSQYKEVLEEESSVAPPVSESSQSSYDEEVLEEEFEYTDDEEVQFSCDKEVLEEETESTGDEKVFASDNDHEMETSVGNDKKISRKGRVVISEDKDDEAVKLRFRRGKVLDLQSVDNGPRRLKFRRGRVIEGNKDRQNIAGRTFKNRSLDLQPENNGPRRLKFREGKVMEGNEDRKGIATRTYKKKDIEATNNSNHGPESVVLKHQGEQGKKDAQGLFNNVIEETASKLVESRKSKVKALVGAFETVISLQDGKPSST